MYRKIIVLFIVLLILAPPSTLQAEVISSPFYSDISAQPGERIRVPVSLRNKANKPIVLDVTIHDFIGQQTTKEPLFTPNPNYSIKSWFRDATLLPKITVPAQSTVTYDAVLDVPYSAEPRTYFGGIFFKSNNPGQETSVASLAYITVGDPSVAVSISDVTYETKESFNKLRSVVAFSLTNIGQSVFTGSKETATIVILDGTGNSIAQQDFGDDIRVLPESIQNFSIELNSLISPAAQTVRITITTPSGETVSQSIAIPEAQVAPTATGESRDTPKGGTTARKDALVMPALVTGAIISILVLSAVIYKARLSKKNGAKTKKNNKS